MLHGHIVEFPYFKFKRNHSAELYGFIYMKIHCKYGSASAERIGRHDCHEGNLSRTRDGISDNRAAASDHVLPDVPLSNTVTDDGKHICVVPHECRESVRFILAFDIKRYRHICAGSCRDVFNAENDVVSGRRCCLEIIYKLRIRIAQVSVHRPNGFKVKTFKAFSTKHLFVCQCSAV